MSAYHLVLPPDGEDASFPWAFTVPTRTPLQNVPSPRARCCGSPW